MKQLFVFLLVTLTITSCKKDSIMETFPENQNERSQYLWLETNKNSLESLKLSDFNEMEFSFQKIVYNRLSAQKKASLWLEKLYNVHSIVNQQQLEFIQKLEAFLTVDLFKEKITITKKKTIDEFVLEGLKNFRI